ncbi:MAG: prepilin-type processing-associated H-X9-DG protein [Rhodothermales bacterium]
MLSTYQRTRFTLVEILSVVAVIAIIAAMLMQSIETVRERGMQANCLSNLRQIGLASHEYTQASNQTMFPFYPSWTPRKKMWEPLMPYLARASESYDYTREEMGIWVCPGQSQENDPRTHLQYGMNNYDYDPNDGDSDGGDHFQGLSGRKLNQIKYHSRTIHLADADPRSSPADIGGVESNKPSQPWPLTSLSEMIHLTGYNALYLDGHVKLWANVPNHDQWAVTAKWD